MYEYQIENGDVRLSPQTAEGSISVAAKRNGSGVGIAVSAL